MGALSRKDDRPPLAQKYCQGWVSPMGPPFACNSASAGIMVAKMPAKSTATSTIGAQQKWLEALGPRGPSLSERIAKTTRMTSRTKGKWMACPKSAQRLRRTTLPRSRARGTGC